MADKKQEFRRDHGIKGIVPEKPKRKERKNEKNSNEKHDQE